MGLLDVGASGAVLAYRLWMRPLPDIGPQGRIVGLAGEQPVEHVLHVDEYVEIVPHGATDDGEQIGGTIARFDVTDEKPVPATCTSTRASPTASSCRRLTS